MSTDRHPNYGYFSSGEVPVAFVAATPTAVDLVAAGGAARRLLIQNLGTGATETLAVELEIRGTYGGFIYILPQSQLDTGEHLAGITKMRVKAGAGGGTAAYTWIPEAMTVLS